jgi:cell division protease FtsH
MQGGAGKAMGFGKSRATMPTEAHGRVTFEDAAGVDEAKQDLQEIVEFLCGPGIFQRRPMPVPVGAKVSTVRSFASCRLSPAPASGA